ncbi:Ras-related protein Rab-26 [Liparis tanakae]|uniref:Ras-related protein Rab-26 n=1 Tax=Liparis tanakae TaxID=230148 RepID=A0A4Z2J156_9TELE|nr:Ras-related protein Rab-26 [Liparis tanakae]
MSARKTSLTDKQARNGTSKYVLERCASVNEYYDIAFKVMLLGDSSVGKTCVLVRFKDGAFLGGNFIATVGIDFRNKVVDIDNLKVKLQVRTRPLPPHCCKQIISSVWHRPTHMVETHLVDDV